MDISKLVDRFSETDFSNYPEFQISKNHLEELYGFMGSEKLGMKKLSAEQIATIIREVKEISIDARAITNSFNRARDKIHTYKDNGEAYFEIMKPRKRLF